MRLHLLVVAVAWSAPAFAQFDFEARRDLPPLHSGARAIAAHDFDGDGRLDLACIEGFTGEGQLAFYGGHGDGTFEPPVSVPAARVGFLDAITLSGIDPVTRVAIAAGDGAGGFTVGQRFSITGPAETGAVGDFDEDGLPDLVVTMPDPRHVRVYRSRGRAGFELLVIHRAKSHVIEAADVDGDGHVDLAMCNQEGDDVWFGDGTGAFPTTLGSMGGSDVALADFDGDGRLDVVAAFFDLDGTGGLTVFMNSCANGRCFQQVDSHVRVGGYYQLAPFDADGDGVEDLAGGIAVLRGRGDGVFDELPISFGGASGFRIDTAHHPAHRVTSRLMGSVTC